MQNGIFSWLHGLPFGNETGHSGGGVRLLLYPIGLPGRQQPDTINAIDNGNVLKHISGTPADHTSKSATD